MYVLIDTNVVIKDYYFRSKKFEALFNYLRKTPHKLILPQIVIDELKSNHKEDIVKLNKDIQAVDKDARLVADIKNAFRQVDPEAEEKKYDLFLKQFIKIHPIKVVKYDEDHYRRIAQRAVTRTPPFVKGKSRDYGFKDAIIWESVIDQIKHGDSALAFISNNVEQFADTNKTALNVTLSKESDRYNSKLRFFTTLEAFLEKYSPPLEEITHDLISAALNEKFEVLKSSGQFSQDHLRDIFQYGFIRPVQQVEMDKIELNNFYVFEVDKKVYSLQAIGLAKARVVYWDPTDHERFADTVITDFKATLKYNNKDKSILVEKFELEKFDIPF